MELQVTEYEYHKYVFSPVHNIGYQYGNRNVTGRGSLGSFVSRLFLKASETSEILTPTYTPLFKLLNVCL
jgi:hypothetical protein